MAALFLITAWTAAAEAAQLTLTWSDNSVDEQGFAIERRGSPPSGSYGQIATVGANITTYTDTSVVGGTSYCFRRTRVQRGRILRVLERGLLPRTRRAGHEPTVTQERHRKRDGHQRPVRRDVRC